MSFLILHVVRGFSQKMGIIKKRGSTCFLTMFWGQKRAILKKKYFHHVSTTAHKKKTRLHVFLQPILCTKIERYWTFPPLCVPPQAWASGNWLAHGDWIRVGTVSVYGLGHMAPVSQYCPRVFDTPFHWNR